MIHELELLPIVLTQVPIYIFKIFLLIFLFFWIASYGLFPKYPASQFGKHFFCSTSQQYIFNIYCGSYSLLGIQVASQLTQHKKKFNTRSQLSSQLPAAASWMGWKVSVLHCPSCLCLRKQKKKGVARELFPRNLFYFPYCSAHWKNGVFHLYKRGQYSELDRTIRKIRDCQEISMWLLPFSSSNSNIYFYQITFSLSTLLSARQLGSQLAIVLYRQLASYKSSITNNMGLLLKKKQGKI